MSRILFNFSELLGKKIVYVNEESCNVVHIILDDDSRYSISAEERAQDIFGPILGEEWYSNRNNEAKEITNCKSKEDLTIHLLSNNKAVRYYAEYKLNQLEKENENGRRNKI